MKLTSARLDRARARLKVNPHDLDAWEILVVDAQTRATPECRTLYEEVLAAHPTASRVWRIYAEAEIAGDANGTRDDEHVKFIFSRCLLACPSAELWRSYTHFVLKTHDDGLTAAGATAVKACYEYTVEHVGEDIASGPLWLDYVGFLKAAAPAHVAPAGLKPDQAESGRMTELRRVYQKALTVPTHSLDAIVREYEAFENSVSKVRKTRSIFELT